MADNDKLITLGGLQAVYEDINNTLNNMVKIDDVQVNRNVIPSSSQQTITADESGKIYLKQVTVAAMEQGSVKIEPSVASSTFDIGFSYDAGSGVITASADFSKDLKDCNSITVKKPGYIGNASNVDVSGQLSYTGSGSTNPTDLDDNLIASNIKKGATVFGVTGSFTEVTTASEVATKSTVLDGKKFFINGGEFTGEMPNKTSTPIPNLTPDTPSLKLEEGYYKDNNIAVSYDDLAINNSNISEEGTCSITALTEFFNQVNVSLTASSVSVSDGSSITGSISAGTSEKKITIGSGWVGTAKEITIAKLDDAARKVYTVTGSFTPSQFTGSNKTYSISNANITTNSEVIIMPASATDASNWGKNGIAVVSMSAGAATLSAIYNTATTAINYKMIIINPYN